MIHSAFHYCPLRPGAALFLVLLLQACDGDGRHPWQLYKAYQAQYLWGLRLVDQAGAIRGVPDFPVDYYQLPDFAAYEDAQARKQAFFEYLRPAVEYHNAVNRERRLLLGGVALKLENGLPLDYPQTRLITDLRLRYRVPTQLTDAEAVQRLLHQVEEIPVPLALAQAAIESGWGTSRFAREGNNLFGQWCYEAGCGLVPGRRLAGAQHEVRRFESVDEAIAAYFRNLNSHPSYAPLRELRQASKAQGVSPSATLLAAGLSQYSERGEVYVEEVRQLIRVNKLESLPDAG